jgi:hypothetical protein
LTYSAQERDYWRAALVNLQVPEAVDLVMKMRVVDLADISFIGSLLIVLCNSV